MDKPDGLLADAGYFGEDNVKRSEPQEIIPHVSDSRQRLNLACEERFKSSPPCPHDADAVNVVAHGLRTAEGKAMYAKRKSMVEKVCSIVKEVLGFGRFHFRALEAPRGEWNLVCMAWNLKRMYALAS